jgi:hypothetical protein
MQRMHGFGQAARTCRSVLPSESLVFLSGSGDDESGMNCLHQIHRRAAALDCYSKMIQILMRTTTGLAICWRGSADFAVSRLA